LESIFELRADDPELAERIMPSLLFN